MNVKSTRSEFGTRRFLRKAFVLAAMIALFGAQSIILAATESPKKFPSPEEVVRALIVAVTGHDTNALASLFGPALGDIISPEQAQRENELADFSDALNTSNHLDRVEQDRCILETGEDRWPFPIPIVRANNAWFFDTEAGKDEIVNRRIGRNELDTLKAVRAYVEAQRDYAGKDRDGDEVLEYAQKLASSPGAKDGLFWSPDVDGEISPLGPAVAVAQSKGYLQNIGEGDTEPFHGYLFRILTRQGKNAAGGKYDYIINGNMIGGFALIAWPAEYGETGIMTFLINQQGRAYQKDLGPKTDSIVHEIKEYDPDKSWARSPD